MEERNVTMEEQNISSNFMGQFLECIYGPVLNWAPFQPPARRRAPASNKYDFIKIEKKGEKEC